jgi:hypothetical protein
MTATELADRIESLDWSHTSLQHQLVMSAAVLALRGSPEAPLENPVGEMRLLLEDLLRCDADSR